LLSICYPSNIDLKIPSFSLYYIIEMKEYIQYTKDITLAEELYNKLESILSVFENRIKSNLVPIFYGDKKSWNFYEWSDGLEGHLFTEDKEEFDLILNSLYSLALQDMTVISKALNRTENIEKYTDTYKNINKAINETFYDEKKGLYKMNKSNEKQIYSILGNALAILCGAANSERSRKIAVQLTENKELTDITLSMSCFKYDALLKTDKEKYSDYVLKDIDKIYKFMLDNNATTFWETIKGESDFENAGSLCHGWSAMPIYYYQILNAQN